jgi:hypothetical protein
VEVAWALGQCLLVQLGGSVGSVSWLPVVYGEERQRVREARHNEVVVATTLIQEQRALM